MHSLQAQFGVAKRVGKEIPCGRVVGSVILCQFMVPTAESAGRGEAFHCEPRDSRLDKLPLDNFFAMTDQGVVDSCTKASNRFAKSPRDRDQFRIVNRYGRYAEPRPNCFGK